MEIIQEIVEESGTVGNRDQQIMVLEPEVH
jgi:hypothetical protein